MVRETSSSGLASLENTVSTQSSKYPLPTRSADLRARHQPAGGTILAHGMKVLYGTQSQNLRQIQIPAV